MSAPRCPCLRGLHHTPNQQGRYGIPVIMPVNGFVERMNRTLLVERFRVRGRQIGCMEVEEIVRSRPLPALRQSRALAPGVSPERTYARPSADGGARRHLDPRNRPCRAGQLAAATGCLFATPECRASTRLVQHEIRCTHTTLPPLPSSEVAIANCQRRYICAKKVTSSGDD